MKQQARATTTGTRAHHNCVNTPTKPNAPMRLPAGSHGPCQLAASHAHSFLLGTTRQKLTAQATRQRSCSEASVTHLFDGIRKALLPNFTKPARIEAFLPHRSGTLNKPAHTPTEPPAFTKPPPSRARITVQQRGSCGSHPGLASSPDFCRSSNMQGDGIAAAGDAARHVQHTVLQAISTWHERSTALTADWKE